LIIGGRQLRVSRSTTGRRETRLLHDADSYSNHDLLPMPPQYEAMLPVLQGLATAEMKRRFDLP
jgi:hypothetical protein